MVALTAGGEPIGSGLILRRERREDWAAVDAVVAAAFGRTDEARLVARLRRECAAVLSLVAVRDDRVVGHILLAPLIAPLRALALAPLSVEPGSQKSGIGAALVSAALRDADSEGWQAVFVVGDPGYYGRFGFDVDAAASFLSRYSGPHFLMRWLRDAGDPATGRIVYPAPFDSL